MDQIWHKSAASRNQLAGCYSITHTCSSKYLTTQ